MDNSNRNTILAVALSIIVLIGWQALYVGPRLEQERQAAEIASQREAAQSTNQTVEQDEVIPRVDGTTPTVSNQSAPSSSQDSAAEETPRVAIQTELVEGSINLQGARIDDLRLRQYRETIDPESPLIVLLSPRGSDDAYFAEFGYLGGNDIGEVPGPKTVWQTDRRPRVERRFAGNPELDQ